uniref:Uncharacterized protein n=1 Tax=Anguilla anguilla TaxID=7936 RepID=A0A0E9XPG8_ANGAN
MREQHSFRRTGITLHQIDFSGLGQTPHFSRPVVYQECIYNCEPSKSFFYFLFYLKRCF